jgi:MOSC domain-containing protein YiiM
MAKYSLSGPVWLGRLGLPGDEHVYEHHGGPDMAVLVYPFDHYGFWRSHGLELPVAAAFGENLSVDGLLEVDVWLGDTFAVGGAIVQVTQPRTPCYKLAARYGRREIPALMQEKGLTGYLLRVLQEGEIVAGDDMRLLEREDHGMSVAEASRIVNLGRRDLDGARRVLAVASLGGAVRRMLLARLGGSEEDDAARLFGDDASSRPAQNTGGANSL